jgi:hypothetical protein
LFQTLTPRVFSDLDLVQTFSKLYNVETHCIVSADGKKNICTVSSEAMAQMLNLPLANLPILELDLLKKVEGWSTQERTSIIQKFVIDPSFTFEEFLVKSEICSPNARLMVSVITSILGYVDDSDIDEVTLAIMNKVVNPENASKFDFA